MKVKFKNRECIIEWSIYSQNNNIAIILLDEKTKELVAFATTNTSEETPLPGVQIKDWSENRGMWQALVDAGVIESEPVEKITSYFVQVKVGKLTKQAEEEFMEYMVFNHDMEFC